MAFVEAFCVAVAPRRVPFGFEKGEHLYLGYGYAIVPLQRFDATIIYPHRKRAKRAYRDKIAHAHIQPHARSMDTDVELRDVRVARHSQLSKHGSLNGYAHGENAEAGPCTARRMLQ